MNRRFGDHNRNEILLKSLKVTNQSNFRITNIFSKKITKIEEKMENHLFIRAKF